MDGMERLEIEERERARLQAQDEYHRKKRHAFIGDSIVAILGIGLLVLLLLLYIAVFVFSPGVLIAMLLWPWLDWAAACMASIATAAAVFGVIYVSIRRMRIAVVVYVIACAAATASISALGGLNYAEDFLRGRYHGGLKQVFSSPPPVVSFSGPAPGFDKQWAAQQGASTDESPATNTTSMASAASEAASASATSESSPVRSASTDSKPELIARTTDAPGAVPPESVQPPDAAQPVHSEGPAAGPSFDCSKAASFAETSICSSPVLSELDRALHDRYVAARRGSDPKRLQEDQQLWLRQRARCKDEACLTDMYRIRIAQLAARRR
jgi:hypothetical protein